VNDFIAARFHSFWAGMMDTAGMLIFSIAGANVERANTNAIFFYWFIWRILR
jgi:hypothetical protein